jgi:UDP-4-amino-4,6-dideoxy-N-acetyl-beta-L-altrosamine transaminase
MSENFISYGRQSIEDSDIEAVVAALKSDWLTQGPAIERFEKGLTTLTGANHAIVVCNATAGLHIACLALDVGPGDLVWTSPNSFVASSNCALYCGGDVDFVDIDPVTLNMSVDKLADKLAAAKAAGRLPKVVIPVHFAGQSCDMQSIAALAQEYGFKIIEDASHGVGGSYAGAPIGSCPYSDIAVFSFHPVKIITTAEGGAAMTNDPVLANRLAQLRSHGITRNATEMDQASEGDWYYQQIDLGLNYRLTDLQAALGANQLERIEAFVARRHQIADFYDKALADLPLQLPIRSNDGVSALHLYPIQLRDATKRRAVFDQLRAAKIGVNVHYIPIHTQPYYRALGFKPGDFPAAEDYYARAISIPMHPLLTDADLDRVVRILEQALA